MKENVSNEKKEKNNLNAWLFFAAFVLWVGATTLPHLVQNSSIDTNRQGIECIIQQLSEHRTNNRSAHQENARHHLYEYTVATQSIPSEASKIDDSICDDWLLDTSDPTTTIIDLNRDRPD